MQKLYFSLTRSEKLEIIGNVFDQLNVDEHVKLIDTFASQPLDFFSAVRCRLIDSRVMEWVREGQLKDLGERLLGPLSTYETDLVGAWTCRGGMASTSILSHSYSLGDALEAGKTLALEQDYVNQIQLAKEYYRDFIPIAPRVAGQGRDVGFKKTNSNTPSPPASPQPSTPLNETMKTY